MIEHDDTLGNFVKKHFTKDNDIEIISKDEIDLVECFSGSLEDFYPILIMKLLSCVIQNCISARLNLIILSVLLKSLCDEVQE